MALIACSECSERVSTLATSCPHCGAPTPRADSGDLWGLVGALAFGEVGGAIGRALGEATHDDAAGGDADDADARPTQICEFFPEFPDEFIDECWQSGYTIMELFCEDDSWFILLWRVAPHRQSIVRQSTFPGSRVKDLWETHEVHNVNATDGVWVVLLQERQADSEQAYVVKASFPSDEIDAAWASGRRVSSIASDGAGNWAIVTEREGYAQSYAFAVSPDDVIRDARKEGRWIQSAAHDGDRWCVLFHGMELIADQQYTLSQRFPWDFLETWTERGYLVTQVRFGGGVYFVVVSELKA